MKKTLGIIICMVGVLSILNSQPIPKAEKYGKKKEMFEERIKKLKKKRSNN